MSNRIVPTPEQFRIFCEFGFSRFPEEVRIFYTCCTQCGIEALQEDEGKLKFMFATVEDIQFAADQGLLLFHHGVREDNGVLHTTHLSAEHMVNVIRDQGIEVQWDGDPEQRFKVVVDRLSFEQLAKLLEKKMHEDRPNVSSVPDSAMKIDSGYDAYIIHIWPETPDRWHYDVSSKEDGYSYERSTEPTKAEAIRAALDTVQDIHFDIN